MTKILILTVLFSRGLFATPLSCAHLLDTPEARQTQAVAGRIIAEDADDAGAVAFVGVSEQELLTLINEGTLPVRQIAYATRNADAPAVAAARDAWVKSTMALLRSRYPDAPLPGKLTLAFLRALSTVVPLVGERLSPSFAEIQLALDLAEIPGLGQGHAARVRRLASLLNVEWQLRFVAGCPTQRSIVRRLSDLPAGGGAQLVLGSSVGSWIRRGLVQVNFSRVDLKDVIAIRANSPAVNEFLGHVEARAGIR